MLSGAVMEEVVVLLGRYPDVAPDKRQWLKTWLRSARPVQFAQLLAHAEAAGHLTRAYALDTDLRQALQAQANRQLHFAAAAFLIITIWGLAVFW